MIHKMRQQEEMFLSLDEKFLLAVAGFSFGIARF